MKKVGHGLTQISTDARKNKQEKRLLTPLFFSQWKMLNSVTEAGDFRGKV
jgi:hypothetical protein